MSDPRDNQLNPQPIPPDDRPTQRKGVSPLIWLLLLIALLAAGWWFYNRSAAPPVDTAPVTPFEPAIGSDQEAAAAAERERADANERRSQERTQAPAPLANRELRPIAQAKPTYPAAAFRAGEEGTVLVKVSVDADGNPTSTEVARSSRSRDLDRAAVEAVKTWKFEPAVKDGKKVASTAQVPVEFKLDQQ